MIDGFHFRLELIKHGGAISSDRGRSWEQAHNWYRKETGIMTFPHRSVKVYLCVSGDEGELSTPDEVLVLGDD